MNRARRPLTQDERRALEEFADLSIPFEDLRRRLSGVVEFEFKATETRLSHFYEHPDPGIRIERHHVEDAVRRLEKAEISVERMRNWATMLLMIDAYDWEGPDEDWIAEKLNEFALLGLNF